MEEHSVTHTESNDGGIVRQGGTSIFRILFQWHDRALVASTPRPQPMLRYRQVARGQQSHDYKMRGPPPPLSHTHHQRITQGSVRRLPDIYN